jgi:hypothetical protein
MTDPVEAWHFLREDGCLNYPPHTRVEVGQTLRIDGAPVMCQRGFHASRVAHDALRYAPGTPQLWACRVRLGGRIVYDTDKLVASERTVLWMAPARQILIGWAVWCATGALFGRAARGRSVDPRSVAALVAAERFLRGEISSAAMQKARAAAAAAAAAYAAYAAYADAAAYAAAAAAYAAANAAANAAAAAAANAAARAQARSLMADELERRLWLLAPAGEKRP